MPIEITRDETPKAAPPAASPDCPKCLGKGHITDLDTNRSKDCWCLMVAKTRRWLGPLNASYHAVEGVGFGEILLAGLPALVTGEWGQVSGHLARALAPRYICSDYQYRFGLYTDEDLRNAFFNPVIKSHYTDGEDIKVTVNHRELVGLRDDLVIVRLGMASVKNVELPNIIKEALSYRASKGKPTWLIDSPDQPFRKGHKAWSEELEGYLVDERFARVKVTS